LAEPPPDRFIEAVRDAKIPMEIGTVIVATHAPHQAKVLEIIRQLGLELKTVFNRSAVIVLPAEINKAGGTKHVLRKLGLSPHEIVAVEDSENDHSLLQFAECPVAVANALDAIKAVAALITRSPAGEGVIELIDDLIATDLQQIDDRLAHRHIALGKQMERALSKSHPTVRISLSQGPRERKINICNGLSRAPDFTIL
jgi:hypothetical protein